MGRHLRHYAKSNQLIEQKITILNCETLPESNIKTASDALWWSFVTITTVGYGDFYPITFVGRIIAGILMTAGIGLFGTFTAYVASFFLQQEKNEEKKREETILSELKVIKDKIEHLEKITEQNLARNK
ncbi:potassium channel family protein [bacterium]|nr:potassium channel family protein [bacterium]